MCLIEWRKTVGIRWNQSILESCVLLPLFCFVCRKTRQCHTLTEAHHDHRPSLRWQHHLWGHPRGEESFRWSAALICSDLDTGYAIGVCVWNRQGIYLLLEAKRSTRSTHSTCEAKIFELDRLDIDASRDVEDSALPCFYFSKVELLHVEPC